MQTRRTASETVFMEARRPPSDPSLMEARRASAGPVFMEAVRAAPAEEPGRLASPMEPPSMADGTFVKVDGAEHPLERACEVAVYLQDHHRSSSKLARFGEIVGIDAEDREYLVMLDDSECLAVPMRRVEWRKVAT